MSKATFTADTTGEVIAISKALIKYHRPPLWRRLFARKPRKMRKLRTVEELRAISPRVRHMRATQKLQDTGGYDLSGISQELRHG